MKRTSFYLISFLLILAACRKDSFITGSDAVVNLSADSLFFDTVFTSVGSITQFFRIYNDNNQKLRIDQVKLSGGSSSFFKINVDGFAGPAVNNIEIGANDSVYVFVSVKIDPSMEDLPFVVRDSIEIQYNGNTRWLQLEAWGQNAHFLRNTVISGTETWTADKPYVILGGIQIDTNATLQIDKGTRVYLHADAPFIVDGTLKVNGEAYDSTRVLFTGDRLDLPYKNFPAAWPGIYFRGVSKDNVLQYADIRNAYQGIVAEQLSVNTNPKVHLTGCIIDNCYDAGLLGVQSDIVAENCLISNCGKNVLFGFGGQYILTHCTVASYSNNYLLHKDPVLLVTDFLKDGNIVYTSDCAATFTNCIFWADNGSTEDEVVTSKQGTGTFNVNFDHCLWKITNQPANVITSNMIVNEPPAFDSINNQRRIYDFHLRETSPALDAGQNTGLLYDLQGKNRAAGTPDLGCYEKQ